MNDDKEWPKYEPPSLERQLERQARRERITWGLLLLTVLGWGGLLLWVGVPTG